MSDFKFDRPERISSFLDDVRMSLSDEHTMNKSALAKAFSQAAGSVGSSSYILRDEFVDRLVNIFKDMKALKNTLSAANIVDLPCWIEIHKGPVANGFLFGTWSLPDRSDTILLMRMWRGNSDCATPFVIAWPASEMANSDKKIDECLTVMPIKKSVTLSKETLMGARNIGLYGMAALAFRLNPALGGPIAEKKPIPFDLIRAAAARAG